MKLVKDIMHKKVICFKPEDTVFDAAKCFCEHNISGAPVVEKDKVAGVISEADIIKFIKLKLPKLDAIAKEPPMLSLLVLSLVKGQIDFRNELKRISRIKIKDFMSKLIISVSPETNILEAAKIMEENDIHRLPVIENGKLVGIISRADIIKTLIE